MWLVIIIGEYLIDNVSLLFVIILMVDLNYNIVNEMDCVVISY